MFTILTFDIYFSTLMLYLPFSTLMFTIVTFDIYLFTLYLPLQPLIFTFLPLMLYLPFSALMFAIVTFDIYLYLPLKPLIFTILTFDTHNSVYCFSGGHVSRGYGTVFGVYSLLRLPQHQ